MQQKKRVAPPPKPPAAQAFPIETLRVEGNRRIPAEKIVAASGLQIGRPAAKSDFDAARARLVATGAFESVGYEFKPSAAGTGYDVVLQVVEVDQVYPYRFEDLPASDDALRTALRKQESVLGDQIPPTAEVIDRYTKAIEQFLGNGVKVTGKVSTDVPGQPAIVFRPPVQRANIAEVRFTGNEVLPSALLTNTLSGVAVGVPYSEAMVRTLLDSSIRPLYEARGRIRVAFPKVVTEKAKNADGVVVIVTVNEGPSYNLGTVRLAGVAPAESEALQKVASWKKDNIANFEEINAGLGRILRRFRGNGYLRIKARVDRDIHDQEHTVDLLVTIDPGPQYTFNKLEIVGLDLTSEPAIRKAWAIKQGKPFNPEYPDSFLNDIREEGVFDNLGRTRSETRIDDAAKTVDVTLYFSGESREGARKKGPGILD